MRVAVLSDIHANWPALEAVCNDLTNRTTIDEYWFLGDLVGYNGQPTPCVQWFQEQVNQQRCRWVVGNHDAYLVSLRIASIPNTSATRAIQHHQYLLTNQFEWLSTQIFNQEHLRHHYDEGNSRFVLVHGSPWQLGLATEYLYPWKSYHIQNAFADLKAQPGLLASTWVLHGHHHFPSLFRYDYGTGHQAPDVTLLDIPYRQPITLSTGVFGVNPGSVGQPRDGDPRAAYAIIDTKANTIEFRRVVYPYRQTQKKMRDKKKFYDDTLIEVLATGQYGFENLPRYRKLYDDSDVKWGKRVRSHRK